MTLRNRRVPARGLTSLELLLILATLFVLLAMLLPAMTGGGPKPSSGIRCMVNLKQVGLAHVLFAEDNHGQFPPQLMATNSEGVSFLDAGSPASYFNLLRPYMHNNRAWICPTDKVKTAGGTNALDNGNVSYFLSLKVTPQMINLVLAGDRHLSWNGKAPKAGIFAVGTNLAVRWTRELHPNVRQGAGTLLFADGHVQFVTNTNLTAMLSVKLLPTHLAIP